MTHGPIILGPHHFQDNQARNVNFHLTNFLPMQRTSELKSGNSQFFIVQPPKGGFFSYKYIHNNDMQEKCALRFGYRKLTFVPILYPFCTLLTLYYTCIYNNNNNKGTKIHIHASHVCVRARTHARTYVTLVFCILCIFVSMVLKYIYSKYLYGYRKNILFVSVYPMVEIMFLIHCGVNTYKVLWKIISQ